MRDVKYGANPPEVPPVAAHRMAVEAYDQAGLDFVCYFDQHVMTIPRSIWTPDLCAAADIYDIDDWFEPWPLMTEAALVTENIHIGLTVTDAVRRPPSVLAQLGMTLDHYSEGRFFLGLGAGENKQCTPYGITRDKPFGHLEEQLRLIKAWWGSKDPIDFEGKFWNVKNARVGAPPLTEGGPDIIVAGGPGKAMRLAAQLADGWYSYAPAGTPNAEVYAEQIAEFNRYAEEAGKDPDKMTKMLAFVVVFGENEEQVEENIRNPVLRWDVAALVPDGHAWKQFGETNPLGDDWAYARDLYPLDWEREDALKVIEGVTPEMVRNLRFCGTPKQVADMIQPFIEAGCNSVMVADWGGLVNSSFFGQTVDALNECYGALREYNGQPNPAGVA